MSAPRIGLCMIVKDESHVLGRCLASLREHVHAWTILDTGSEDPGELERIARQHLVCTAVMGTPSRTPHAVPLPGQFVRGEWKGFGPSRTEALRLAEEAGGVDYHLVVDADDVLDFQVCDAESVWHHVKTGGAPDRDAYYLPIDDHGTRYERLLLLRADGGWSYRGPVHEFPHRDTPAGPGRLGEIKATPSRLIRPVYKRIGGGARSAVPQREKFLRDAELLKAELASNPQGEWAPRWLFYLAQSYKDAGETERAAMTYRARACLSDGWHQERYVSALRVAQLEPEHATEWFSKAFALDPCRGEAPFWQAKQVLEEGGASADLHALLPATYAASLTPPADALFSEPQVYEWARNLAKQLRERIAQRSCDKACDDGPDVSRALAIDGWSTQAELQWLAEQASKCDNIAEIGTWLGRSAVAMACNTKGRVLCVDTWEGTEADGHRALLEGKPHDWLFKEFVRNVEGLDNIDSHTGRSVFVAQDYASETGPDIDWARFDMVFIDGDHSEQAVRADIAAWLPLVRPGGLLCGHDVDWQSVEAAVADMLPGWQRGAGSIWWVRV